MIKIVIYTCFLFSILIGRLYSQTASLDQNSLEDSILKIIAAEKIDTIKARYFNTLGYELRRNNPSIAIKYANKALAIFKTYNNISGEANSNFFIGTGYLNLSKHQQALAYFKKAIDQGSIINDKKVVGSSYNNIGIVYINQGNGAEALKNYIKGLQFRLEYGDSTLIAGSYLNIGNVYFYQKKHKESLDFYKLAATIFDLKKNRFGFANALGNIGNGYLALGKTDTALTYFEKALLINSQIKDKRGVSSAYTHIGTCYSVLGKFLLAMEYLQKSLIIEIESENESGISETKLQIARVEMALNNYNKAEQILVENNKILKKIKAIDNLAESYSLLSDIAAIKKDYNNSLTYYRTSIAYRDTMLNTQTSEKILQQQLMFDFKQKEDSAKQEQIKIDIIRKEELRRQKTVTTVSICAGLLVFIFLIIAVRAFLGKQKANQVISEQKKEVENQKQLLDNKQKEIIDSINYAKRIQYSLLAHKELLAKNLSEHFILFKPKDIVSGDFYWATEHKNKFYFAVCDSTGHGVPGAFMSILNIGFLSEAINEKEIVEPNLILNYVRQRLIESISEEEQKDGMDAILICFNKNDRSITYAAANNEPILISGNKIIELPKDKMPVGKGEKTNDFALFTIEATKGDILYLYTDGFADQFGGPKGKKFKYKQLNDLLLANSKKDMNMQEELLVNEFKDWKGNLEQVDDVCIIGIRV
jgi:serine phosphatase RsbU (regulator of sigma subunit)/Tfp pilus assembly protein PilF